jgi:hypothetical protein
MPKIPEDPTRRFLEYYGEYLTAKEGAAGFGSVLSLVEENFRKWVTPPRNQNTAKRFSSLS